MGHLLAKLDDYALATAGQDLASGKRGGPLRASAHGLARFFQAYVYRLGFLDGARGFILAVLYGQYAFNKYVALWALAQPDSARAADEAATPEISRSGDPADIG